MSGAGDARRIAAPLGEDVARSLEAAERVELSGVVYTARDAAHGRIVEAIRAGGDLPFDLDGAVIFYVGPTPAPPGSERAVGSAGPTTASRMDPLMRPLL